MAPGRPKAVAVSSIKAVAVSRGAGAWAANEPPVREATASAQAVVIL